MKRSHRLAPRANRSTRAPIGARPDLQAITAKAAALSPRMSEGPFFASDPDHACVWLRAIHVAVADLAAAAREGTRRLRHRVLSRAELRRQVRAAERELIALLAAAEAGLTGLSTQKGGSGE